MESVPLKPAKILLFLSSLTFQIVFFGAAIFLISLSSYLIGYTYLIGNSLAGNDAFSFYTIVDWIGKFYPKVPFWFPLEGGGVSFTGYQWFAAYIVNIISHTTSFNNVQAFRLLGFGAIPLTGIGIFVYCWTRLVEIKAVVLRQAIGIIAALFFVTAPASWVWLVRWGFYAEQASIMFIPWILIFLDLYLEKLFEGKHDLYYRLSFLGVIVFGVLGFMTHFYIVITTLILFTTLLIVKFFSQKENKLALIKRISIPLIIFIAIFSCAFASRYYSYNRYNSVVIAGGLTGGSNIADNRQGTADSLLTPKMLLSLEDVSSDKLLMARDLIVDMRFPFYVWLLLIPCLVFGLFNSKKIFAFALIAVIGFVVNTNIDAYILFSKFPVISSIPIINEIPIGFLGRLFFVTGRVIIPIAAAYGAFITWELLGNLPLKLFKEKKFGYNIFSSVKVVVVLILGITTAGILIYKYYNTPFIRDYINIGAFIKYKIDIRDVWQTSGRPGAILTMEYSPEEQAILNKNPIYNKTVDLHYLKYECAFDGPGITTKKIYPSGHICSYFPQPDPAIVSIFAPPISELIKTQKYCNSLALEAKVGDKAYCLAFYQTSIWDQLSWKNWPKIKISGDISDEINGKKEFFNGLPNPGVYRYDISGFAARTVESAPLANSNSEIQLYINNLSLLYNLWNYQTQVMYGIYAPYQNPGVLTELGKWFGLNYVYLSGTPLEPIDYWKTDPNWTKITGLGDDGWRQFNLNTNVTTWDSRPKVLVISDNSKNFYDAAFRFFTKGGMNYEQAVPVQGTKNIDDYSESELSKYNVVFMMAYGYKNRSKAYNLLDTYVKNGGKLIFDTGWQFYTPDFELKNAPAFMPFDSLTWKNLDSKSNFLVNDSSIANNIDASKMGDLTYGNASWGVSVPNKVKDWGNVVVSANGSPLIITGDYGKGKVTWIGFNIVPHSETKDSLEEVKLFNSLMTNYLGDGSTNTAYTLSKIRPYPDQVEFKLEQSVAAPSSIYFREAFYPDWHATLVSHGISSNLKIMRGGAGFMVVPLPKVNAGDSVILKIVPSLGQRTADFATFLAFAFLIIYLLIPKIFTKINLPSIKIKMPRFRNNVFSSNDEDKDY